MMKRLGLALIVLLFIGLLMPRWAVLLVVAVICLAETAPKTIIRTYRRPMPKMARPKLRLKGSRICEDQRLNDALSEVIEKILHAYILRWHDNICPNSSIFTEHLRDTLGICFASLHDLTKSIDWCEFVVEEWLPIITKHIQAYASAEAELKATPGLHTRLSETATYHNRIATLFGHYSTLHPGAVDPQKSLREMVDKLLPVVLKNEPELMDFPLTHNLIRSICSNCVLNPVITLLANPDFWNQKLIQLVEKAFSDHAKVRRMRKLVQLSLVGDRLPLLTPQTDYEGFKDFLRAVDNLASVALARQAHYFLVLNLQKVQHRDDRPPTKADTLYLQRLKNAKLALEEKISELDPHSLEVNDPFKDLGLNGILNDPKCLPLFDSFMNTQPFNYLRVYQMASSLLDNSSVDPLGGLDISGTAKHVDPKDTATITELYQLLDNVNEALPDDIVLALEEFVLKPDHEHFIEVQRILWRFRDLIVQKLGEYVVQFKKSKWFDEYMLLAGNSTKTVDRLQTDDISGDYSDIDHEGVMEAIQDAIKDTEGLTDRMSDEGSDDEESEVSEVMNNLKFMLRNNRQQNVSHLIETLESDITQLRSQIDVLRQLARKAELTNDVSELHLLQKSTSSLEREINRKLLTKESLIMKSMRTTFYQNTTISIPNAKQSFDTTGEYTSYVVEVKRQNEKSWVIDRRFRQFYSLHKILRQYFPDLGTWDFPKKKMVLKFQQRQFVEARRKLFETYLRKLLKIKEVCDHLAFQMFLTSDSFPDSYYDLAAENPAYDSTNRVEEEETKVFIQPICDAFLTIFNIDEKVEWLKGRAIVIVIQQLLGGTIEKRLRDIAGSVPSKFPDILQIGSENIWPDTPRVPVIRTLADTVKARDLTRLLLRRITKAWFARLFGTSKCEFAATTIFGMLQNPTLNRHLFLSLIELTTNKLCEKSNRRLSLREKSLPSTPVL